jgi:hypothetical protein
MALEPSFLQAWHYLICLIKQNPGLLTQSILLKKLLVCVFLIRYPNGSLAHITSFVVHHGEGKRYLLEEKNCNVWVIMNCSNFLITFIKIDRYVPVDYFFIVQNYSKIKQHVI